TPLALPPVSVPVQVDVPRPETASVAVQDGVATGLPSTMVLPSAGPLTVTPGATVSIFRLKDPLPEFPALSLPWWLPLWAPSPDTTSSVSHESSPDRLSVQVVWTVTGWLYQPLALGASVGPVVTVGGVSSMLRCSTSMPVLPTLSSDMAATSCTPSVVSVWAPGQVATPDDASEHE